MNTNVRANSSVNLVVEMARLTSQAQDLAKKARKHRKSLSSDNYYGNKMAELRADAANAFRGLSTTSVGDTTAIAELIELVFGAKTEMDARRDAARELTYRLKTDGIGSVGGHTPSDDSLFPLTILVNSHRGYLVTIGRQMNGCFAEGWYDACAVMMRRLFEVAIIEAFEGKDRAAAIRGPDGNIVHLSELVARTLSEPALQLSRNTRKALPELRDVGHLSAHGRFYHAQKQDIDRVRTNFRVTIEELLHHAGLLAAHSASIA